MKSLMEEVIEIGYIDFSKINIAVIGDCMLDIYHYGSVERISPEAPVPIFKSNNIEPEYRLGGACNTALNLAKLGVQTHLFGFVGKDINATYIKSYLLENNINFTLIELKDYPTITKSRYFSKNQQIIRIDHENTDGEIYNHGKQEQLIKAFNEMCPRMDAVIISDYGKGTLYNPVLSTIIDNCAEKTPFFVDPKLNNWTFYKNAFCITPNWVEFKDACHRPLMTYDLDEVSIIARDLCHKHNIEYILITLGSKGMQLCDKNGYVDARSAKAEEVYDVSGAGDTVIATIAAAYCKGYPMTVGMQLATMAAKVVIGHLGTYAVTDSELRLELCKVHNSTSGKEC
jgi:D-beta-D-heptose 7-phosphate kinase/D-beta-D-heptose 1-phosphate adenosyltransferase